MNRLQMEGKWQQARGRMKEAWGALTDDDIDRADGNWDQLVGTIREKTGETTEAIQERADEIFGSDDD